MSVGSAHRTPMTALTALVVPCVMIGGCRWAAAGSSAGAPLPGWHRACGPGIGCSGGRSLRPHAADWACRVGVLVVSAHASGVAEPAGGWRSNRGRRSARESRLGISVPERDRSRSMTATCHRRCSYCYVCRLCVRRSCPGGCGFLGLCTGGADWLRLCDAEVGGTSSRIPAEGAALAGRWRPNRCPPCIPCGSVGAEGQCWD